MVKKYNTNADTEHSRKLRAETAAKWTKQARKEGKKGQFQVTGDAGDISTIKADLAKIDGNSWAEKIAFLLDFYKNND